MKLYQTSLDQTGVAIFVTKDNKEKQVPLFSLDPVGEANKLLNVVPNVERVKHVFVTNNLCTNRVEDTIQEVINREHYLPEDLIEYIVSGFSYVIGYEPRFSVSYYS